jgi:aminocarboxymuconate-semialdehyde decarboxylase
VLDELTALRVVLMHGGGYLPYQIGRLDHGYRVRPEAHGSAHPPSAYLDRFWFDTVTHAPAPLRFLAGLVGADHVVYGTDFPFDMAAGPLADQLAGTGIGDTGLIAGGNASDLFGLALPTPGT